MKTLALALACAVVAQARAEWVQMDVYSYGYLCPHCVNKRHPDGIGANGELIQPGKTLAADKSIPFGTMVYVQSKWWIVGDRGRAITAGKLDLARRTHREAKRAGVSRERVWVSR